MKLEAGAARLLVQAMSEDAHVEAAKHHAEGMAAERRSARLAQLAAILDDEQIVKLYDRLIATDLEGEDLEITATGGEA